MLVRSQALSAEVLQGWLACLAASALVPPVNGIVPRGVVVLRTQHKNSGEIAKNNACSRWRQIFRRCQGWPRPLRVGTRRRRKQRKNRYQRDAKGETRGFFDQRSRGTWADPHFRAKVAPKKIRRLTGLVNRPGRQSMRQLLKNAT